jgi:hypothetical protein
MIIKEDEPHGTMIRSNYSGMVLVKLRYVWVNLNNSVEWRDEDLDFTEWTLVHRPTDAPDWEYLTVSVHIPEYRWPNLAATRIPYTSAEEAIAGLGEYYTENPDEWKILRRPASGDWEEVKYLCEFTNEDDNE